MQMQKERLSGERLLPSSTRDEGQAQNRGRGLARVDCHCSPFKVCKAAELRLTGRRISTEQLTKGTGATWTTPSWAESVFRLQSQSTRPLPASKQVWVRAPNTSPGSRREQYRKTEERQILRRAMKSKLLSSQPRQRVPGTEEQAAHCANYTQNQWCYVILCASKKWQDFVTFQGSDSLILGFR